MDQVARVELKNTVSKGLTSIPIMVQETYSGNVMLASNSIRIYINDNGWVVAEIKDYMGNWQTVIVSYVAHTLKE